MLACLLDKDRSLILKATEKRQSFPFSSKVQNFRPCEPSPGVTAAALLLEQGKRGWSSEEDKKAKVIEQGCKLMSECRKELLEQNYNESRLFCYLVSDFSDSCR